MSTLLSSIPQAPFTDPLFRLSVDQYHAMIESGVLTEDDPVELLEGVLVFKMPKKPLHRIAVSKLLRILASLFPETYSIQSQDPITLEDGEPEPDFTVFRGKAEDFQDSHPTADVVALVIEVSDTTLARDRGIKLRSYARAKIPVYWIIDITARQVEVYTNPQSEAYTQCRVLTESDALPVEIAGQAIATIPVLAILP